MTDVHRAWLALLLAVLDGDCETRVHGLLCGGEDSHLAVAVAHHAAHQMVDSIDAEDHHEIRTEIAAELVALAHDG